MITLNPDNQDFLLQKRAEYQARIGFHLPEELKDAGNEVLAVYADRSGTFSIIQNLVRIETIDALLEHSDGVDVTALVEQLAEKYEVGVSIEKEVDLIAHYNENGAKVNSQYPARGTGVTQRSGGAQDSVLGDAEAGRSFLRTLAERAREQSKDNDRGSGR